MVEAELKKSMNRPRHSARCNWCLRTLERLLRPALLINRQIGRILQANRRAAARFEVPPIDSSTRWRLICVLKESRASSIHP